jgi:hypothetical protein
LISHNEQVPGLKINKYWTRAEQDKWKPEDIDRRAEQILDVILDHWQVG